MTKLKTTPAGLPPVPAGTSEALYRELPLSTGSNEFRLKWLEVLDYRVNPITGRGRFVLYGVGQWVNHVMDWRGCNFFHGRIKGSPTFATVEEALRWAREASRSGFIAEGMRLRGHHSGEGSCLKGCEDREQLTVFFSSLKDEAKFEEALAKVSVRAGRKS